MKIVISIPRLTPVGLKLLLAIALVVASAGVLIQLGFAAWLLLAAFCLIVLAIGLIWTSVTTVTDDEEISLDEALDLAAPARDEERKLAVLRGIKDLEYERGLGKISEADFQQLSQRYRREAKALLARLDTSESSLRQRALDFVSVELQGAGATKDPNP